jgi:hypothetical protein
LGELSLRVAQILSERIRYTSIHTEDYVKTGLVLALLSCFASVGWTYGKDSNPAIVTAVKSLGPNTRPSDLAVFQTDPLSAVELLVQRIRPIGEKKVLADEQRSHPEAMRVIWSIRALRYLSGLNFKGKTKYRFKGDVEGERAQLIGLTGESEVFFFGTWMSRDSIYVAPRDAQLQIIEKWKEWARLHAKDHTFIAPKEINDWYP